MKISANYTAFYGADFIEYSLRSIYPFVDKILIARGTKSWAVGYAGIRHDPIDDLKGKIEHFIKHEDPDKKIILFSGVWQTDTIQRNFLIKEANKLKMDYALLVDVDEVWEPQDLKTLLKVVKNNPKELVFSVGIMHYFRSLFWRFEDRGGKVNYVFKLPEVAHGWIRHGILASGPTIEIASRKVHVAYHHYGYAFPSKIIEQKITFWGHCGEVVPNWFRNIFMRWEPRRHYPVYAPTGQKWNPLKKVKLINIMKKHPLAAKELIK